MKLTLRISLLFFILTTTACRSNSITSAPVLPQTVRPPSTPIGQAIATAATLPRPLASATPHLPSKSPSQPSVPTALSRDAALIDLPLRLGATWVYSATYRQNYRDADGTRRRLTPEAVATFRITDTIVQAQEDAQIFSAQVQREVIQTGGVVYKQFSGLAKPDTQQYWYVVVDGDIYLQPELDLTRLDLADVVYKTPLAQQSMCWWPSPDQRAIYPELVGCMGAEWGTRHVEGPVAVRVPSEIYPACSLVIETQRGISDIESLCPNIGLVRRSWHHVAQSVGESFDATSAYLQELIQHTS